MNYTPPLIVLKILPLAIYLLLLMSITHTLHVYDVTSILLFPLEECHYKASLIRQVGVVVMSSLSFCLCEKSLYLIFISEEQLFWVMNSWLALIFLLAL